MRARMALIQANISLEHREVLLKNKPPQMTKASPKATVPVLILPDETVIEESFDVMIWALRHHDPDNWLGENDQFLKQGQSLIQQCEQMFKPLLDRYKYADRHPESPEHYRDQGLVYLERLDQRLSQSKYLVTDTLSIADIAIAPFVRQFSHVDKEWFMQCGLDFLTVWLNEFLQSSLFERAMIKHPLWDFEQVAT